MAITTILLKQGFTDPGTILQLGEPAFDASANILYIGTGVGSPAIPYYPNVSTGGGTYYVTNTSTYYVTNTSTYIINGSTGGITNPFDFLKDGKFTDHYSDYFDAGFEQGWSFVNVDVLDAGSY